MKKKIVKKVETVKPAPKKNGETKYGKLRGILSQGKSWTMAELMKSGFDEKNVKCALSILRNPKRTKELIVVRFDAEKKIYVLSK